MSVAVDRAEAPSPLSHVLSSEWLKLRSVRSTACLAGAVALVLAVACLVSALMTADWDASPLDRQAVFSTAEPGVMVVPFAQFAFGALGVLAVAAEYGSGMIRPALVAVPRRGVLLLAKALVVGGVAAVAAAGLRFLAAVAGLWITGDRPAPISAFPSLGAAVPVLLAETASIALFALLGLALGFVLRSTAGALVALCGLLFVVPSLAPLLPAPWDVRVSGVLPGSLAAQASGVADGPLSPWGAGAMMLLYAVVGLAAAYVVFTRRDA